MEQIPGLAKSRTRPQRHSPCGEQPCQKELAYSSSGFGISQVFPCVRLDVDTSALQLTNMEVENHLFVKESSLPRDRFPLPC